MENKKIKTVTIRISAQEYENLNNKSKELGLSLSSFMRMCSLKYKLL